MSEPTSPGESKAWELLELKEPEEVCSAAAVTHDAASGRYVIRSFNTDFQVSTADRTISSTSPGSGVLLGKLGHFFRLSLLWYLVSAKNIFCTGRFIRLENLPGGEIFTRGSHVLPIEPLARAYAGSRDRFLAKGRSLDGEPAAAGDAAIRLLPLPRVPVVLALWLQDEEFPPRVDLLFDSTCILQLPMDIIWSVAMTTLLVMVEPL